MTWIDWMRSRIISGAVAILLTLPMGAPSAMAFARVNTDEMRAPAAADSPDALSQIEGDLTGQPPKGSVPNVYRYVIGHFAPAGVRRFTVKEVAEGIGQSVRWIREDLEELVKVGVLKQDTEKSPHHFWITEEADVLVTSSEVQEQFYEQLRVAYRFANPARGNLRQAQQAFAALGATPSAIAKAPTRPIDELARAYAPFNRFASTPGLLAKLLPYVELTPDETGQTRLIIRDGQKEALRPLVRDLAYAAVVETNKEVRDAARWAIRELAPQYGMRSASLKPFYQAMGHGEITKVTLPAMNTRWRSYFMARAALRQAKVRNAGAVVFEIAASEVTYTGEGHDYAGMASAVKAAAIDVGYEIPIFLKMDHTQVKAANYWDDPEAEIARLKGVIRKGLEADFMNVDIDTSTIEKPPRFVEQEVTTWVRQALRDGRLNDVFPKESERQLLISQLTDPKSKEDEVLLNPEAVDTVLVGVQTIKPALLEDVVFEWEPGVQAQPLAKLLLAKIRAALQSQWDREQQRESAKVYAALNEFARAEATRIFGTPDIGLGSEVGEVGKKNTTLGQALAFLDLVKEILDPKGIKDSDALSLQTGASHGGVIDPATGKPLKKTDIDFQTHRAVSRAIRTERYGYKAGPIQHGASTLSDPLMRLFPDYEVAEIHLATEFANLLLYTGIFGEPTIVGTKLYVPTGTVVTDEMKRSLIETAIGKDPEDEDARQQLFTNLQVVEMPHAEPALRQQVLEAIKVIAVKAKMWDQQAPLSREELLDTLRAKGGFKDQVKTVSHNQSILELYWQLPPPIAAVVDDMWETKIGVYFDSLGVKDTREVVLKHAQYAVKPALRHPPLALARALAKERTTLITDEPPAVIEEPLQLAREMTDATATLMVAEGFRYSVDSGDKAGIEQVGKRGDKRAKQIYANWLAARGVRLDLLGSEGIGTRRDALPPDAAFGVNEAVNRFGLGRKLRGYVDVIENTKGLPNKGMGRWDEMKPATSGTTSMAVFTTGEGIGVVPDSPYAGLFITTVDPSKVQTYIDNPLNPHVETMDGILPQLERIAADAKGGPRSVNDITVHVFNRPRETKRLEALHEIKGERGRIEGRTYYPGLEIVWDYPDGTVRHAVTASAGAKDGRLHVALMSGGPDEAAGNLGIAKALSKSHGAVGSVIFYSGNLPDRPEGGEAEQGKATDLSNGLDFDAEDIAEWQRYRPSDYKKIVEEHHLFTIGDWDGDVYAALPAITNDRVFNQDGTADLSNGFYRTSTVLVQQVGNEPGRIIPDANDVNLVEVERTDARGALALVDPAAADLSVVDPEGELLARMEGPDESINLIGNLEEVSTENPLVLLQVEQALEQFRIRKGLTTKEEAAKVSKVKYVLDTGRTISKENGMRVARVTLLSNKEWDAEALVEKALEVVDYKVGFPDVRIERSRYAKEQSGVYYVHVDFMGSGADLAAREFLAEPSIAQRVEQAAEVRVKRLFAGVASTNPGVSGKGAAAQPQREWFTLAIERPKQIDSAIGPTAWLETVPEVKGVKVVLETRSVNEPVVEGSKTSAAGATAVVVAGIGKRRSDLLARLNRAVADDGTMRPVEVTHTKETAAHAEQYRTTVKETISGV